MAFKSLCRRNRSPCRSNIFVGHGQLMKIGDFGMARIVGEANNRRVSTLLAGVQCTLAHTCIVKAQAGRM